MPKLLSKLELAVKPEHPTDKLTQRRNRLIERLAEQKELVKCELEGTEYKAYKYITKVDSETGDNVKVKVPKRLKQWFYKVQDQYFLEIRYGSKSLELAKNKHAIAVGDKSRLTSILDTVIEALKAGELDQQLLAIKRVGQE